MTRPIPLSSRAGRVLRRERHQRKVRAFVYWPLVAIVGVGLGLGASAVLEDDEPVELGPATSETQP